MILKMEKVIKNYGDFNLNCSLNINEGQITGIIGQNGAGKSTAFKCILGLIKYDGNIEIFNKKQSQLTKNDMENMSAVLSDSSFNNALNITDIINVLECLYTSFNKDNFIKQCKDFELPFNKKIKDFSTGMKAKLKILIAISHNARLLILDEPTLGLDIIARDEILDMLRTYMEENEDSSILISSHISTDIESLCDDIYMIHNGNIILHEDTDTLIDEYGILKLTDEQFDKIDRHYVIKTMKAPFGYECIVNNKKFYLDNYPEIVVENGSIDEIITITVGGK